MCEHRFCNALPGSAESPDSASGFQVFQRCTESETFDSDSAPASDEYTPTPLRSGGFKVGGARDKTKKGGPSDDVIILSQL